MPYDWSTIGRVRILGVPTVSDEITDTEQTASAKNHTVVAGTERLVLQTFGFDIGQNVSARIPTYDGVALTLVGAPDNNWNHFGTVWEMIDPPVGTASLSVPHAARTLSPNEGVMWAAQNLANLNTTTPRRTAIVIDSESESPHTWDVPCEVGDVVLFAYAQQGGTPRINTTPTLDATNWTLLVPVGAYGSSKVGFAARGPGKATNVVIAPNAITHGAGVGVAYVPKPEDRVISGTVEHNATPVSGATVRVINQTLQTVRTTTTNGSGVYSFNVEAGYLYHVVVETTISSQRYNYRSVWDLTPAVV